jgi:hypothetical protein
MSSTRYAKPGSPLRQSKFSSSAELETGLLANLVARRCSILETAEERELIWFLQLLSHHEGGIEKIAGEIAERFKARAGTAAMVHFGVKRGQVYDREQVEAVRAELESPGTAEFPLRGETATDISSLVENWEADCKRHEAANRHPISYAAEKFLSVCQDRLSGLAEDLKVFCLNPTRRLNAAAPWYFADLPACLSEYHAEWIADRRSASVTTALGQALNDECDYALESRCMVLIEGGARMGKTHSAKAWCESRPGRARYVQVPSTNDEIGFFRAIAKALGVASGLGWKAVQLRERIEDVLQTGDLLLCLDEAHYCWPNSNYHHALPNRINWIMTALVNHDVPIALITTPQFIATQKVVENRTHWTSEQFTGRIGHYLPLPASLDEIDLEKVARALLPKGDEKSIEILAEYANSSAKYLAGIEAVVRRARYLAKRDGRDDANRADIKAAIKESVIPSDTALAQSLATPAKASGRRLARTVQTPLKDDSGALQRRAGADIESDLVDRSSTAINRLDPVRSDRASRAGSELITG